MSACGGRAERPRPQEAEGKGKPRPPRRHGALQQCPPLCGGKRRNLRPLSEPGGRASERWRRPAAGGSSPPMGALATAFRSGRRFCWLHEAGGGRTAGGEGRAPPSRKESATPPLSRPRSSISLIVRGRSKLIGSRRRAIPLPNTDSGHVAFLRRLCHT